jgi:ADP-dependent NAD(P)H-hydrate dehydratase / NAD(P)H-hydrate epimerase
VPTARPRIAAPFLGASPLFTAATLREADHRATSRHGIPSIVLMERAGLESARVIWTRYPNAKKALVVVGSGNNGGDGMVVARHLAEAGWRVEVVSVNGSPPATPDAHVVSNIAIGLGVSLRAFDAMAPMSEGAVVVDALLGTGSHGAPREPLGRVITWMNGARGPVVALDLPSGVDADTGAVPGEAVRADLTITYHGDKVGLHVAPGREHAGEVVVVDIGIPSAVTCEVAGWLFGPSAAAAIPAKRSDGHKYSAGAVVIVTGSPGMTGAGALASTAALRAGAGLVVATVPAPLSPVMSAQVAEVMFAPVPDEEGALCAAAIDEILTQAGRASALALGPGIGRAPATTDAVTGLLEGSDLPMVLDADGLWHIGDAPERLQEHAGGLILTPHSGEAARLLGISREDVDAGRIDAARSLAVRSGAVVVLKGPGTLVCDPEGGLAVCAHGSPALSTAGTGDVLTGIIAAALAKGMPPFVAAVAAVAAHASAGEATGHGDGTLAGDVAAALPAVIAAARTV